MRGASTPWSIMFMAPMRSMDWSVSNPENIVVAKRLRTSGRRSACRWCSETWDTHSTRNPADPIAGSHISSSGVGRMSSTIIRMMWRGVRNWPFSPAAAILPRRYS